VVNVKKVFGYIASFMLGVAVAVTSMLLIHDSKAEPTPIPEPTPIVIEKEVIKEVPVEVVKEVVKEVEKPTDLEKVVKDCKNSCVMIYAYKGDTINQGSGWVYNGYIITAKHVVEGYKKIEVFTDDTDNPRIASVHYIDPDLDLAVLKASIMLPSLVLGDSNKLIEGEKLISISCPGNIKNMVDECVNSGIRHYSDGSYIALSENSIGAGSSGGAVFNYNSEVIALLTNQDLAVPINTLKPILENLK
jgi:S1-C subfamily serine protease